jgi:hypothetical protein
MSEPEGTTALTPAGATAKIRAEMAEIPTKRLVYIVEKIMAWWDKAEEGDAGKFSAVRGMIFEMNKWMGYPDERIFIENLESGDPKQVIEQYCSILLALAGERMGEGELLIDPEAWGRQGKEICTVGGMPYKDYMNELARLVMPKENDSGSDH